MTVFVVERFLPGWDAERQHELMDILAESGEVQRELGVRHLRSILIADDETCLCLFEAVDIGDLVIFNQRLGLHVDRMVVAEDRPARSPLSTDGQF